MNFEEYVKSYLIENGMFPKNAVKVLLSIQTDEANAAMRGRWLDSTEGYPKCMLSLITVSAARAALDWIDANCPQAWYRPMFADLWSDRKTVSTTKPPKPDAAT